MPQRQSWITMPSPAKGSVIGNSFAINGRLRSELYIDAVDTAGNLVVLTTLQASSVELHKAYGRELTWEPLPGKKGMPSRGLHQRRRESHEAYIDWFFDSGARLHKSLAVIGYPA